MCIIQCVLYGKPYASMNYVENKDDFAYAETRYTSPEKMARKKQDMHKYYCCKIKNTSLIFV